jgi:hypothetical protein
LQLTEFLRADDGVDRYFAVTKPRKCKLRHAAADATLAGGTVAVVFAGQYAVWKGEPTRSRRRSAPSAIGISSRSTVRPIKAVFDLQTDKGRPFTQVRERVTCGIHQAGASEMPA